MSGIDKIDRKILSILQGDGRIANVELAERIGLSPTSVGERLKRLQRDGFVEGYGAGSIRIGSAWGCWSLSRCCSTRPRPMFSNGFPGRFVSLRKCWNVIWSPAVLTIS